MSLVVKVVTLHSSGGPLHTVTLLCCQPQAFLTPPTIYLDKNPKNLLINQKRRDNYRRGDSIYTDRWRRLFPVSTQRPRAETVVGWAVENLDPWTFIFYMFFFFFFFTINLHKQENQKPKKKKNKRGKKTKNEVLRAWSLKSIHPNSKALICQRTVHWYYLEEEEQWSGDTNNGEINIKKVCTKQITC